MDRLQLFLSQCGLVVLLPHHSAFALFPILMAGLRKWGPIPFLLVAVVVGFFARVYLLYIHPSSGQWVLGGCGLSRLPEFAFGMVLGSWFAKHPDSFENWLLRGRGLLTGLCLYPVALLVYQLPEDTWRLIF